MRLRTGILLISIVVSVTGAIAHAVNIAKTSYFEAKKSVQFELSYEIYSFFPTAAVYCPRVWIKDDTLQVTYSKKSRKYHVDKFDNFNDTVWVYDTLESLIKFRQSSIDSIIYIVKHINKDEYLNDSLVFTFNPAIIDGGTIGIDIKYDTLKSLRIELGNTFDSAALQIVNIINPYLPSTQQLHIPYDDWKRANEWWKRDKEKWAKKKKKKARN